MGNLTVVLFLYVLTLLGCNKNTFTSTDPATTKNSVDLNSVCVNCAIEKTGFKGLATISPTCGGAIPVGGIFDCEAPYEGYFDVLECQDNTSMLGCSVILNFQSDISGQFSVLIAPGSYLLQRHNSMSEKLILPRMSTVQVDIVKGMLTDVVIQLDSGIRIPEAN